MPQFVKEKGDFLDGVGLQSARVARVMCERSRAACVAGTTYEATCLPVVECLTYISTRFPLATRCLYPLHIKLSKANHEVLLYTLRSSAQQLVAILEEFFRYIHYRTQNYSKQGAETARQAVAQTRHAIGLDPLMRTFVILIRAVLKIGTYKPSSVTLNLLYYRK